MDKKSKVHEMLKMMEKDPPETPFKFRRFIVGKTQMELYVETNISQGRISSMERGQLKPEPWERKALAKALKIRPENLLFPVDYDENGNVKTTR